MTWHHSLNPTLTFYVPVVQVFIRLFSDTHEMSLIQAKTNP